MIMSNRDFKFDSPKSQLHKHPRPKSTEQNKTVSKAVVVKQQKNPFTILMKKSYKYKDEAHQMMKSMSQEKLNNLIKEYYRNSYADSKLRLRYNPK